MTKVRPDGSGEIRVLAMDGGGVLGLLPATLVAGIETELGPIHQHFDVVAGTSTGALIAAALACPSPNKADDIWNIYRHEPFAIFPKQRSLRNPTAKPVRQGDFDAALQTYLQAARLRDACCEVIIPTFDLLTREALLLTRAEACDHSPAVTLSDAVLASAAAPTYLPPVSLTWRGHKRLCVDGGVFANSPSLAAITALRANFPRRPLRVLSLGCGTERAHDGTAATGGLAGRARRWLAGDVSEPTNLGWLSALYGLMSDASASMAEQASTSLLGDAFLRIQPTFATGERPAMDEATTKARTRMQDVADRTWKTHSRRILDFLTD